MNRIALSVLALGAVTLAMADPIKRATYPAISPDGNTILFSWQGDLWSIPRTGGRAVRLTVHAANDTRPKWFPDGSRIAFASNRYGSFDVFTIKPDGTDLKRVTFDSSVEYPASVSADGKVIYGHTSLWSRGDLFSVSSKGGDLVRLTTHPLEAAYLPTLSPDGKTVYYNRGGYRETAWQKSTMQSSALPEIWSADNTVPLSNHKRVTNNEWIDLSPHQAADGGIYAISNRNGWPNVWRLGKNEKQLTFHKDGTCRNLSVSASGRFVVYEFESVLHVLDTTTGVTNPLPIDVPADARLNPVAEITVSGGANAFEVAPDGKRAVLAARGDLFLLPERGGTTRRLTTNPSLDFSPVWLDAKTILYTEGGGITRVLKTMSLDGKSKEFYKDSVDVLNALVSPDGKTVAFHRGESEIMVIPAAGGAAKVIAKGNFTDTWSDGPQFSWSPDSKWLVTSFITGRRADITLIEVATGKQIVIAKAVNKPQQGGPSVPQFLANGRGVFFTNPEFQERDLFLVDLVPNDVTFSEDDLDKIDEKKAAEANKDVTVYLPGIEYRMRRLSSKGASSPASSADGKTIYSIQEAGIVATNATTGGSSTLLASTPGLAPRALSTSGSKVYVSDGTGRLFSFAQGGPATPSPISYSATYLVDQRVEEKALFEEIWFAIDRGYYDPKLNGKDWKAIRSKFAEIVPFVHSRSDFYALMGEMMEELDSSHLGATAPAEDTPGQLRDTTGFLGIDLDGQALLGGKLVVGRVLSQSPADHPSSKLEVGDHIVKVDGESVGAGTLSLAEALSRKTSRKVVLTVERKGQNVDVTIRPGSLAQRSQLEYETYVAETRKRVSELSKGQLGYVHIAAMDQVSLARFLRESRTEGEGKKGMIIDVRFNGGGSTAVDILGVLVKTPWMIRTTRGEYGVKLSENIYRSEALELPTGLLCNQWSFSNAEVITEGFRKLKLGPIVGERTPGYVIGTGGYGLWDGGFIRMPAIGAYAVNGENLENNGRRPDITVWFDPNAWLQGRDLQIERLVQELLKKVD